MSDKVKTHKDLEVWKKPIDLVEEVYKITEKFSQKEKYGLTFQMRNAAISIPSNIAEGAARNSTKEFIQFLYIALGSLSELETQLLIAQRIKYLSESSVLERLEKLMILLIGLINSLERKNK